MKACDLVHLARHENRVDVQILVKDGSQIEEEAIEVVHHREEIQKEIRHVEVEQGKETYQLKSVYTQPQELC